MMRYLIILWAVSVASCTPKSEYHQLRGETMGTYYSITYEGVDPEGMRLEVTQLLEDFNASLSTYIPTSLISRLNASPEGIVLPDTDPYFEPVLLRAEELKTMTSGKLNTAIMPMLRYWRDNSSAIDTSISEARRQLVQQSSFGIEDRAGERWIKKTPAGAELDFSSLAKGYGIDIVAEHLRKKGAKNYLVDIGGEASASGVNSIGQAWTLAINTPREGSGLTDVELIIQLDDKSIATSGTYRQFYEKEGKKIAHIMDPLTGFGSQSDLLSASVIADDCMTADGIATALMVCTLEEAQAFLRQHEVPACLIYDADGSEPLERYYANGFEEMVLQTQ